MREPFAEIFRRKYGRYAQGGGCRKIALRMGLWCLRYALAPRFRRTSLRSGGEFLRIAFDLSGSLDDYLVAYNYVAHFFDFLEGAPARMEVFARRDRLEAVRAILDSEVRDYETGDPPGAYDLYLAVRRFPTVVSYNKRRLARLAPKLLALVAVYRDFLQEHTALAGQPSVCSGLAARYSQCLGRTRVQMTDIGGMLGIGTELRPLPGDAGSGRDANQICERDNAVLDRLGITGEFCTLNVDPCAEPCARSVQREGSPEGLEPLCRGTRCWPLEYYERLVSDPRGPLKGRKIVQIGAVPAPCVKGVHISLAGRTDASELKTLLRWSALHIDGDGWMVHLRNALGGGPSVVLFGPTSPECHGYSGNVNLRAAGCGVCGGYCEGTHARWEVRCLKTGGEPECMARLEPKMVAEALDRTEAAGRCRNEIH